MAKDELLKQLKGLKYKIGAKERTEELERLKALKEDKEIKATYILRESIVVKIRLLAKDQKRTIKSIVNEAMEDILKKHNNEK